MKFTFLGTSAGKPTTERNVSALALELDQDNKWYLFDCGEATQHQLLHTPLSLNKLHSIFITHLHGDHYYGLLGLIASKTLENSSSELTIYGPKGLEHFLESTVQTDYKQMSYKLRIVELEAGDQLQFDKFSLQVLNLHHSVESFAYAIKEHDITNRLNEKKLRAAGLEPSPLYAKLKSQASITVDGKKFISKEYMLEPIKGRYVIIAGDNQDPEIMQEALNDLDLLIHECTYTKEVYEALPIKFLHTTADSLGKSAQKHSIKNLIATHISPRYSQKSLGVDILHDEIIQNYKGRSFIAHDFDTFQLSREKILSKIN